MDGRKIMLLVGALVMAALTAFMARSLMTGSSAPRADANMPAPATVSGKEVLVAARALPVGTILDAASLKFQPWPEELVEDAYYLKGKTDLPTLQGTVVRFAIPAGQPITQGALVKPGDRGFLAAALSPGMRAVTVPVSAQSAVAGFVFPGDRVDLILTQSVEGGGDGPALKASETVLRNLRVLATDQRTDNKVGEDGKVDVQTYSTVTVEVTPKIAEKIAVAQTIGQLSLSLRSLADNRGELEQAIASGAVDVPDDPDAEKKMLAFVDAQPIDTRPTYSTGADVSRFQRATVPGEATMGPPQMSAPGDGSVAASGVGQSNVITGPTVRVARGNAVTVVPVGGKN
ncbi:Flp pilus assembly protein CpaB [Stakelama saccharophila]|uniref:Flp pilus assembly protein CpaB n=1 Tax=Stakelama saccharophila TaxID=3075605 RepID=A0ABZ0B7R3_9SPHN|nr:Flp pilus assembly protein CpaB [Stakelama sp. W311]WNO53329.1 Flp pilus assembly protein CpaB [Stakelama sp. W311]